MVDDEFNELVKRKFAELERNNGRVPAVQELADSLGIDSRILARKLKKAIATLGTDIQTEGTSAFKSTLSELLSGELLLKGMPGFMDLNMLLEQAKRDVRGSELCWTVESNEYNLRVSAAHNHGHLWFLWGPKGQVFARITADVSDICELLESVANHEIVDPTFISHLSGEPVPFERFEQEAIPYQDPIPTEDLPANVLHFRKPYRHSED